MNCNSDNLVIFTNDDGSETFEEMVSGAVEGMHIEVSGAGNRLRIAKGQTFVGCNLNISGNNNTLNIELSKNPIYHSLFHFAPPGHERSITIGAGFSGGGHFRVVEDGTYIKIGERCLFSWDITVMASDYHAIYDDRGHVINKATSLTIGDDVWVGCKTTILKDTTIPDGCIIGANSVITRPFEDKRCLIAGNPARIIKKNVRWNYYEPHLAPTIEAVLPDQNSTEPSRKRGSLMSLLQRFRILQPKTNI